MKKTIKVVAIALAIVIGGSTVGTMVKQKDPKPGGIIFLQK